MNKNYLYHIVKKEILTIQSKYLFKNVLLCISGGLDSIVLFDIVNRINKEEKIFDFSILHYNHNQRNTAFKDELLCEKLSKDNNIFMYKGYLENKENKLTSETLMRYARYKYIFEIQKKKSFDSIFTAHHLDDQIETFYLREQQTSDNIILSSIRKKYKSLYRPLIKIEKKYLYFYAKENKLKWNEDETNSNNTIIRNKIRNKIIPALRLENKNYKNEIICKKIINRVNNFIDNNIDIINNNIYVNINELKSINVVEIKYIIKKCYKILMNKEIYLSNNHIDLFCNYINKIENKKYFSFNEFFFAYKINNKLILFEKINYKSYKIKVKSDPLNLEQGILTTDLNNNFNFLNNKNSILIEESIFKQGLFVRNWIEGDKIIFNKEGKKKKLKKIFSELKILPFIKKNIPLLVDSKDEILWVIGYRKKYINKLHNGNSIMLKWEIN